MRAGRATTGGGRARWHALSGCTQTRADRSATLAPRRWWPATADGRGLSDDLLAPCKLIFCFRVGLWLGLGGR